MAVGLYRDTCRKNPSHRTFRYPSKFNVEHLPSHHHDRNLLADCIRSVSELTVRVTVNYVSDNRPSTMPGSVKPYPGYSIRGTRRMTVGTGWVHSVYRFPDKYNSQLRTCPCRDCRNLSEQIKEFALIRIHTATHVVFDDLEGEHTTCHLLLNSCAADISNDTIELKGIWRVFSDINTDRCSMITVTHDMELAARLERLTIYRDNLKECYIIKCLQYGPPEEEQNNKDGLFGMVSHLTARSSMSLGDHIDNILVKEGRIGYMYTTPTYPASSGGKIFTIWKDLRLWGFEHTHSYGSCMKQEQINHSSHGVGYLPPFHSHPEAGSSSTDSPTNPRVQQETRGPGEVQECLPETDLHSCFMVCTKNPGHQNFTPIEEFSEKHLPPDGRHLVEHIKVLGNIVALVEVKNISRERPKTFPSTDVKYPRSPQRGSAWIYKVLTFGNRSGVDLGRCTCEECRISDNPKQHFAYIIIHTAAHVVFDEFEGKHTTCSLFYNKVKTLEACAGVVKLSGMSRVWSDVEKDVCKMLYVTHDPEVIDRVEKVVNEWENARRSLELMNKMQFSQESSSTDTNRQALAIAVSHPHGCSKQVSIGECVSIEDSGNGQTVYKYTTPTCRGSSGAYVFVEGRDWQSWDDHVHCVSKEDNRYIVFCK